MLWVDVLLVKKLWFVCIWDAEIGWGKDVWDVLNWTAWTGCGLGMARLFCGCKARAGSVFEAVGFVDGLCKTLGKG